MSDLDSVISDILSGPINEGVVDPSVAMTKTTSDEVVVSESVPRNETAKKPRVALRAPVEGKIELSTGGTPFKTATMYPKGYLQLAISKYQKFVVYKSDLETLAQFFSGPGYAALLAEAEANGLKDR